MVMITRSAYKKATESLSSSDISQKNILRMPPWCSAGKVYERRKPRKASPSWETESSYPLRENIWDYLNDQSSRFDDSRRLHVKKNKHKNRVNSTGGKVKLLACLLAVFGLSVPFWIADEIPKIEVLKNLLPEIKHLSLVNLGTTSIGEECCDKLRHLTMALSRVELELRNMLRLRRKLSLSLPNNRTQRFKQALSLLFALTIRERYNVIRVTESTNNIIFYNKMLIHGARAVKGRNTEEWGTQVALWGVVPLWRTAPPPNTILALRKPKPSDCWPFSGSYGEVVIELPRKMPVSTLSLEHIRPDTARSAPRDFVIYAILDNGTYVKATDGTYSYKKTAKQFFSLKIGNVYTQNIVFRVLSNQGNPKYTCIYRIQLYRNVDNTFLL